MLNLGKRQNKRRERLTVYMLSFQKLPGPGGRFTVTWGNIFSFTFALENNMFLKINQERSGV